MVLRVPWSVVRSPRSMARGLPRLRRTLPRSITYGHSVRDPQPGVAPGVAESETEMNQSPIRSFRDLDAWNVAMELAVACYRLARQLPVEERFALSAQIRRAAVSVPSNIAEGHSTGSDGVFGRQVRTSLGSVGELETQLELAGSACCRRRTWTRC